MQGCPGSRMQSFEKRDSGTTEDITGKRPSELRQWPIQMHLVSPQAPYFEKSDVLLAADCVPFALADFHRDHLKGNTLAIACPKLDSGQEIYIEKIRALVDEARINTLTAMIMQVPCCSGLLAIAKQGLERAERKIPLKVVVVSLQGEVLSEQWA
ncbi:MAG: 4Fe-4S ferredoxin [bacterium]|nr:MAG: 4Fe-4S ferredoxin [bacterium]